MKRAVLSDLAVRQAKPRAERYRLLDGRGLLVEVMPSGNKYWRQLYFVDGKRKTVTIGSYPTVSIAEARQKADELRAGLERGIDPHDILNPPPKPTFREVAAQWLSKKGAGWVDAHREAVERRLNNYIYPALGDRPIADIRATDVLAVLRKIEAMGRVDTARRVRQTFGQVARYGVAIGACEVDVSAPLTDALATAQHKHFAALTDKGDIRQLLLAMRGYPGFIVKYALWFSLYTLCRPGEIRHAEWSEIDLDAATWSIPAEKMKRRKPHATPLCRQAVKLLRELKPLTGQGRWVFPSIRGDGRPMGAGSVRAALRLMGYTNAEMTSHGFRSLGSTTLNSLGYRPDVIEAALAHEISGVRGVYARSDFWPERVHMMQAWADWLDGLMADDECCHQNR